MDGAMLQDFEDMQFLNVETRNPDIRAVLNSAPVKQLDPYPFSSNPAYLKYGNQ
jgi:hypothetical protein